MWPLAIMCAACAATALGIAGLSYHAFVLWLRREQDMDRAALASVPELREQVEKLARDQDGLRMTLDVMKTGRR